MNQIAFQPAFDPLHAVFRLLRLRDLFRKPPKPLAIDHVRILDFYLLFPFRLAGMRAPVTMRTLKVVAKSYQHTVPYGEQPDDRMVFNRMEPMQKAALQALALRSLIDKEALENGTVVATAEQLPEPVVARILAANASEADLLAVLGALAEFPLNGMDGLKHRTGLLEHRYDAV